MASGNFLAQMGGGSGGGGIKSVQRGVASISGGATQADITVSAVNTAKAFLLCSGYGSIGGGGGDQRVDYQLLNANTIRFSVPGGSTFGVTGIAWQLVEFN